MRLIASLVLLSTFAFLGMGSRIPTDYREKVLAQPEVNVITLMDYSTPVHFANFDPTMAKQCCPATCNGDYCVWLSHIRAFSPHGVLLLIIHRCFMPFIYS